MSVDVYRPEALVEGVDLAQAGSYAQVDYLSVGEVAGLLGVAPATLRSWGRRYGMMPAARTEGGHRRYTPGDLARLRSMQELVAAGVMPSEAARQVLSQTHQPGGAGAGLPLVPIRLRALPGSRPLAIAGASADARALARAVARVDVEAAGGQVRDLLVRRGALVTWAGVISPVLRAIAVGRRRAGGEAGVELTLSEAVTDAVRGYCGFLPAPGRTRPVLLVGAPDELRILPLHIIRAALAERRVGSVLLGAVSAETVAIEARRTGARQVLVWREVADRTPASTAGCAAPDGDGLSRSAAGLLPRGLPEAVVLGGDGWAGVPLPTSLRRVPDLRAAVRLLAAHPAGMPDGASRPSAALGRLA